MGRITKDDRCLIMGLRTEKKWAAKRLISEFLNKRWSQSSLTRLLRKIDNYGTTKRKSGSSRPRSVRTAVNILTVDDMICSQDDAPCSHKSPHDVLSGMTVDISNTAVLLE